MHYNAAIYADEAFCLENNFVSIHRTSASWRKLVQDGPVVSRMFVLLKKQQHSIHQRSGGRSERPPPASTKSDLVQAGILHFGHDEAEAAT